MADQTLEQMIMKEFRRVTAGQRTATPAIAGLPVATNPKPSAAAQSTAGSKAAGSTAAGLRTPMTQQPPMAGLTGGLPPTLAITRQNSAATGAVNKGYTEPAPVTAPAASPSGSSVAGTIGQTALKVFTSGLGLMPLVSGLAGLFGGGSATPAPLVKYAMPRAIQIEAANSRGGGSLSSADYGQSGAPRAYDATAPAAAGQASGAGSQIVVNVQAMDSRSFLDHSQDIAQAVREAMLNMHSLNDVVSEL